MYQYIFIYLLIRSTSCNEEVCNVVLSSQKRQPFIKIECTKSSICNRNFTVSYILQHASYINVKIDILRLILGRCCSNCWRLNQHNNMRSVLELMPISKNSSDFIYPVLGRRDTVKKFGYYFVPVFGLESVMYITRKADTNIVNGIVASYPLLILSLLIASMSGFIVWSLETWKNVDEFPRAFPIGWFEGTWYSFVSMTTVGYGDKAPKSVVGKLFAIIWIFIGLLLCGLITATITTTILDANSPPPPELKGERVGMIRYHDFEGYVVAMLGGIKAEVDGHDFKELIVGLIRKLKTKEIGGFVLDKRTYHFISRLLIDFRFDQKRPELNLLSNYTKEIEYFLYKTLVTEKRYTGLEQYYGILMKHEKDYNYFHPTIKDNQFTIQRLNEDFLLENYYNKSSLNNQWFYSSVTDILFSPKGKYFQNSLIVAFSINIFLFAIGIIYEMKRRKSFNKKKDDLRDKIENNHSNL